MFCDPLSMKMKTFLIVDGSSMLASAYYATLPPFALKAKTEEEKERAYQYIPSTVDHLYMNGVLRMLDSVLSIVKYQKPDYIAFAFDRDRETTFRREMYADYKNNRQETPLPLKQQFATMEHILKILGFQVFDSERYEADDIAGSLAGTFCEKDINVILMTRDADYLQLINDEKHISVWMCGKEDGRNAKENLPYGVKRYMERDVLSEYGLENCKQIIDLKALAGDTSDNIPGAKGIGQKTATPLLFEYKDIETLYQTVESESEEVLKKYGIKPGIKKKLLEHKEDVFLSKRLATIKTDLKYDFRIEDFSYCIKEETVNIIKNVAYPIANRKNAPVFSQNNRK